jgi:hypothetical protein
MWERVLEADLPPRQLASPPQPHPPPPLFLLRLLDTDPWRQTPRRRVTASSTSTHRAAPGTSYRRTCASAPGCSTSSGRSPDSWPSRRWTIGQCWRYERMTRGRRREHYGIWIFLVCLKFWYVYSFLRN